MFANKWKSLNPDSWVLNIVRAGYRIEFSSTPPARGLLRVTPIPPDLSQRQALEGEIHGLLEKRAIYVADPSQSHNLIRSTFFLTPKKPNLWRPILNLKPINKMYITTKKFRMETLSSIIPSLSQGMWATTIDLKDAYLHIPIHPDFHRFLAFRYRNVDYCFRALPFGLATAPRVFTRVSRAVVAHLRRNGILLFAYLDDWLILGNSESQAQINTDHVLRCLQELGWVVNWEKSSPTPKQSITYLGALLDLHSGMVFPTKERVATLVSAVNDLMTTKSPVARSWLRLLGLMASMVDILPMCRLRMRPVQFYVLRRFKPAFHPLSWKIPVEQEIVPFLLWWTVSDHLLQGRPFTQSRPLTSITTDASSFGWGAVWNAESAAGQWSNSERQLHMNVLELKAVFNAVKLWGDSLCGHEVTVISDNSTTVAYINHQGGTRSLNLCTLTWDLLTFCQDRDIVLRANHLAGKLNVLADALSRGKLDPNEWELAQPWADHIFNLFDRPFVDLFASADNHKLPTFCTRFHHPMAWGLDALSLDWDGLSTYAFPPLRLILKTLIKFRLSRGDMLLVAPFWPRQPWFPLLLGHSMSNHPMGYT